MQSREQDLFFLRRDYRQNRGKERPIRLPARVETDGLLFLCRDKICPMPPQTILPHGREGFRSLLARMEALAWRRRGVLEAGVDFYGFDAWIKARLLFLELNPQEEPALWRPDWPVRTINIDAAGEAQIEITLFIDLFEVATLPDEIAGPSSSLGAARMPDDTDAAGWVLLSARDYYDGKYEM